jgi:hypothetical protein
MVAPTKYVQDFDFSDYTASNPNDPIPGVRVDTELGLLKATTDETIDNLALIQRSDGALANLSVGIDQIKAEVTFAIQSATTWQTATAYELRDAVYINNGLYYCTEAHTSGVFATDLAAVKWAVIWTADSQITAAQAAQTAAEAAQTAAEAAQAAAAASETAAGVSEANAAASYDAFDDRYLGSKASDPTLDNDGDALIDGALYWNTTNNNMYVYDLGGTAWVAALSANDFVSKTSGTGSAGIPVGTTAERDGSPATGYFRYNSTETQFEGYDGSAWGQIGGGAGYFKGDNGTVGSSAGDIFRINEAELNANVTIAATENASATGPVGVASGVTLTVDGVLVII